MKLDLFNSGNGNKESKNISINIKDESECLLALQGKWNITLNGYYGDEDINLRFLIDRNDVHLYSKKESQSSWNMDMADEVSKLKIMPYMTDHAYTEIYHRLVHFEDIKENRDIRGKLSMTDKMGSMKLYKDRVEMLSMIGKSDFSEGWD